MARVDTLTNFLTDVADAIRTKAGTQGTIQASSFDTSIGNIETIEDGYVSEFAYTGSSVTGKVNQLIKKVSEIDVSNSTTLAMLFDGCSNLTSVKLTNTSNVITFQRMFRNCKSLIEAPQLNTLTATSFVQMFSGCTSLTTVPIYDTSSTTNGLGGMFTGCTSLSNTSLDNILQMCIGATSYTGTKTLTTLGITATNYPASTIESLPHYSDFINAGWTTGYE
jgi:hypothetical protein